MLLLAELPAVQRAPTARALMAYLGLVPTELGMATRGVFIGIPLATRRLSEVGGFRTERHFSPFAASRGVPGHAIHETAPERRPKV